MAPAPSIPNLMASAKSEGVFPQAVIVDKRYENLRVLPEEEASETAGKKIGTHSQAFHCDDVVACAILKWHSDYKDAVVVRTRDDKVLQTCDVVVDVGKIHDPAARRFDHHMSDFHDTFREGDEICLSSAGLVYKHLGEECLLNLLTTCLAVDIDAASTSFKALYQKLYYAFLLEVDAIDNGVEMLSPDNPEKPKFSVHTSLGARVSRMNPSWVDTSTPSDYNARFAKAVRVAGLEFANTAISLWRSWLPGRVIVAEALTQRKKHHESGYVLVLDKFCFWKEHLHVLEAESAENQPEQAVHIIYVLAPHSGGREWRIQCVNKEDSMFQSRLPLPSAWRGKDAEELSKACEVEGATFVHRAGFIGGNKSFEGAMAMIDKALQSELPSYVPEYTLSPQQKRQQMKKEREEFLELVKRYNAEKSNKRQKING